MGVKRLPAHLRRVHAPRRPGLRDLLGRRKVLVAGVIVIGVASLAGGLAGDAGVLVGARPAQGLGAALTLPAALSILTTSFTEGKDRHTALGVWAA